MRKIQQLMNMRGRWVLITGGAGHIGRAAAEALAEIGATVILADRPAAAPEDVADALGRQLGIPVHGFGCDLANSADIRDIPDRISRWTSSLSTVINAAALVGTSELQGWTVPFVDQGEEAWRKALDINLTAPFLVCQTLTPHLRASGHGCIINIASIYGMVGPDWSLYEDTTMGNPAAYGASKGGLIQLTRWLSTTLAPDVRVNAITPGGIARGQSASFTHRYKARTPLARLGTEEDIKGAIAFLASDLSAYVTGHNLVVDGGWTAW